LKIIIIIPARFNSSRFPGKPLIKLLGKPMIQWVAELSSKVVTKKNVYVATENRKIFNTISNLGYKSIMTSKNCLTGTDRLAEVAKKINADIYINVQGDEPLIKPKDIKKIINAKIKYPNDIINGFTIVEKHEDVKSLNLPKVVFSKDKRLLYISRQTLPGYKEIKKKPDIYYKQVCIYAFNRQELLLYGKCKKKGKIESSEDIEIIRYLDLNKTIRMVQTSQGSLAVDEPKDVKKVEKALKKI
jgi:3-deoxy-manno-octulosonate cytidylyltransferase (CMP-KDO synthetase)